MDAHDATGAVDLVDIGSPSLRTLHATVLGEQDGLFELRIDEKDVTGPAVGGLVVINWIHHEHPRVSATVIERDGPFLRAMERRRKARDRRVFPRVVGGIPLRYRIVHTREAEVVTARWMAGAPDAAPASEWRHPDPFMNFSATGLRFDDEPLAEAGDILLCELGVGGRPEHWRAVATVVRLIPIHGAHEIPGACHHVAVMFSDAPTALTE
ncbi:MAG: hypothetical protein KC933_41060, partial [Myxococcales bacterium]|nr:hypothetical protein [Myxococcales bacterium]